MAQAFRAAPPHVVNKIQNRLGLVNGGAVAIHHPANAAWIWPLAFIFDERRIVLVNPEFAAAGETLPKWFSA
jgi:hypothetical protein